MSSRRSVPWAKCPSFQAALAHTVAFDQQKGAELGKFENTAAYPHIDKANYCI